MATAADAGVVERARAMAWVRGLRTRQRGGGVGIDRSLRIALCGRLVVAREHKADGSSSWGAVHEHCRDLACPTCARLRQRKLSAALRVFIEPRIERAHFCTFTQCKRGIHEEKADGAADRVLASWRECTSLETAGGRLVRLFWQGGSRSLEVVLAKAGTVRRDGSRVAMTGWHAHLHALLDASVPTLAACWDVICWIGRRLRVLELDDDPEREEVRILMYFAQRAERLLARLWNDDEGVANEWEQLGAKVLRWRWLLASPGADSRAQDIQRADIDRVGQATKYITKPFEIRSDRLARELFVAMQDRKAFRAFGSWRSWQKQVEEEEDDERDVKLEVSRTPLDHVLDAAAAFETAERFDPARAHDRVVVDFLGGEVSVSARAVLDDVARCRGTFMRRDRNERTDAFDDKAAEQRECSARGVVFRLNALGLFDGTRPRSTWVPPPAPLAAHFQRAATAWETAAKELRRELRAVA